VIIMTDADDDGCHIQNLLIAFFYEHMRPLIEQGHLYIACPPLYRLYNAKENIYCWTDEELVEARKKFSSKSKYTLSRFKGLGEMDAPVLGKTTMEKGSRKLIKVTIDDADECEDKVHLFMGKDADRRKTWIADNIDFSFHQDAFEEEKSHEVQK
ncbi:MAG: DNA topoisomerase IV subunit B, partial [Bacilli bacterium]|nr:DNA topoisomerase IV subunit B [Bacilli bacterium]